MKRVIKGKRYDTDKATLIGEHVAGEPGQEGYTRESLYKKRGGEYFVRVQGPYTLDALVPLSVKEAGNWLMDNNGRAAYMEEFESQGLTTINVTMTLDCKRKLDRIANDNHIPRSRVVDTLILAHYGKMYDGD